MNPTNPFLNTINLYYRMTLSDTKRQIESFKIHLHKIHSCLKFISEIENNRSIQFLDLTLTKFGDRFAFKIYKKPTEKKQNKANNP